MRRLTRTSTVGAVLAAITLLATSSCADDPDGSADPVGSPGALTVEFGTDAISAPAELPTGVATFDVLTPEGPDERQIQLFRLEDGADVSAFRTALATDDFGGALQMARPAGGIDLDPGGSTELTVELAAARYLFFDPDTGNLSDLMVASGGEPGAAVPVDGTVEMRNFEIALPAEFGRGTYALESTDEFVHGLTLIELDDGVTLAEVRALLATDADLPGTEVLRAGNLALGTRQIVELDLPAGRYVAASYFPDFGSGTTQAAQGMVAEFTVEG